jgi:hypothetical protein
MRFLNVRPSVVLVSIVFLCAAMSGGVRAAVPVVDRTLPYDVIWTTPSKDAAGSMPMGNGEVGINLWVADNGDLQFYISRSDSFSEISRLLKVGYVRVALSPNPFVNGAPFRQHLHLHDGVCEITGGEGSGKVTLKVFVDSSAPVVYVVGESASPITVKATAECWRTEPKTIPKSEQKSAWTMHGAPFPLIESADVFPNVSSPGAVVWYHRNESSVAPSTLQVQSLESAADKVADPLIHRTFGGWLTGDHFKATAGHSIETAAPVTTFALRTAVPCEQTATPSAWIADAKKIAAASVDSAKAMADTIAWWHGYWDRSWVDTDGGRGITVPISKQPLRVGVDSDGANKFPGELARVELYDRVFTADEIAKSAAGAAPATGRSQTQVAPLAPSHFEKGLTITAWIKPNALHAGRILDKMTAGGSDGFLLDTDPGDTLRLIVGSEILSAPAGSLKTGRWQHVAATADCASGVMRIYLDGKIVAERGGDAVSPIARGYALQQYVQACGGRGTYPIKFNGGIFTVEPKAMGLKFDADYRAWGDCFWWQNTRHMYHPMLAGGDYEMMDPMFRMYESAVPLAEARTELYHGVKGCYFPETMTIWGTYSNGDYGWNRKGHEPQDVLCPYWQYAWNQGPELVDLMLDRWDYTDDSAFLKQQVLPMAQSVLTYFDTRFKRDANGKIILNPTQSVETFWTGVINDMPSVAGLNDITTRLCALPANLTTPDQRAFFTRMKASCPEVPIEDRVIDGKSVRMLAPAEKYNPARSNVENPEEYGIWPFRLFGIGKPGLDEAIAAYDHRVNHLDVGWGYDGNCAALLGLTDEAARILEKKCANSRHGYRWPATWGPNFDWLPDQNHGGNLLETTQLMLLQCDGEKIRLLSAWPKKWDVSFKLHATLQTVVECVYKNGTIEKLEVTPAGRRADVVMPAGVSVAR